MDIKITGRATIEVEVAIEDGVVKTHNCELGDWWGEEICREVEFSDLIKDAVLPKGEYKLIINLEKI
jgi:hypothetical protein